jgi:hypothetical protein
MGRCLPYPVSTPPRVLGDLFLSLCGKLTMKIYAPSHLACKPTKA